MMKLGIFASGLGALILFASFANDTAPDGTHNIGLLQFQLMLFQLGGLVALCGVLCLITAAVLARFERAGILPPADFTPANQKQGE